MVRCHVRLPDSPKLKSSSRLHGLGLHAPEQRQRLQETDAWAEDDHARTHAKKKKPVA